MQRTSRDSKPSAFVCRHRRAALTTSRGSEVIVFLPPQLLVLVSGRLVGNPSFTRLGKGSSSLVKDLGPCAKGRATDTPRLVWHREVPVSKSRRASRVSLPARRGCGTPHGDSAS